MTIFQRAGYGAILGLIMGALASAWAILASLLERFGRAESLGVGIISLVIAYLVGGVVGGAVAGLFSVLARYWIGAMFVGLLGALPFFLSLHLVENGLSHPANFSGILILSLVLGAPGGLIMRFIIRTADPFGPIK